MAILRNTPLFRRCILAFAAAPLLFSLAGCPATEEPNGLGSNPNATAPTLQPKPAAPAGAQAAAQQRTAQTQQAQQTAAAQQQAQKVQALLTQVETSYSSGVNNYNANHLDAARQDFDAAVDAMLSSGMDLKNDPQLADEFDQLLSAINSLELVALKQGNGFSPALEEAPADAADEVTFAPNPELVGKVTAELKTTTSDLPLVVNDYVAGWIQAFSTKPALHAHLVSSLRRAGKYKEMISRILREQGVPQDLIYQAITESGFQPQALNRKSGAGGMWQFMPFGNYGLERNGYFDERFDPEKSTIAYAKYMKFLYAQTGDWYLAMAAYDWGLGRVQHLVARTGYADYWELYRRGGLPAETKAYIPSVIAAVIMARNPDQYGLTDLNPDAPVLSDKVTTSYAIDLRLVADVTNATVPEIVALNPALLRLSTPRDIAYDLHIPPGTKQLYADRIADVPEEDRASWRFHVVKSGETLEEIATSLHSHATEIATLNELTAGKPLAAGDELVVPVATVSASASVQRYTPRAHDTLVTVADRFGITVEQLRSWNHLSANRIVAGHALYVAEPTRLAPSTRSARRRSPAAGSTKSGRTTHPQAAHTGSRAGAESSAAHSHAAPMRSHAAPINPRSKASTTPHKKSSR